MDSVNPATGAKIKSYSEYSSEKLEGIFKQAQKSFEIWRRLPIRERGLKMKNAEKVLLKNKDEYATLMAEEMGKPFVQGQAEIEKCGRVCGFYSQEAEQYLAPTVIKTEAKKSFVTYEPLGIVLAVMPWNFPFWQVFRCAAPTLMAGNAMILKHASNVSGCSLAIEEIFKQADFPEGLFRSVLVPGAKVSELIGHPLVQAVTLTGSTEAGQSVAGHAGSLIKKTVLELGGSDAYIILEDADIEQAATTCVASRMINAGQSCVSAKRFIVVESVLNEFAEAFLEKMREQKMGPPLEEGTTLGPLARHDLRDQLHAIVEESVKQGAQLLFGGTIPEGPGAFYPPTVLLNVKPEMPAYREELFGPVAVILKAKDEEEAIKIANDTIFGLGAAVFTKDVVHGQRIAVEELQAGCCFVNEMVRSDPRLPFGGIKQSGYGRELGSFGIHEFVNIKTVYIK